jgi:hypothetical protein
MVPANTCGSITLYKKMVLFLALSAKDRWLGPTAAIAPRKDFTAVVLKIMLNALPQFTMAQVIRAIHIAK